MCIDRLVTTLPNGTTKVELKLISNSIQSQLQWEYDVVDKDGTFVKTYSGNEIPVNSFNGSSYLRLEYDPNRRISQVRAKIKGYDGNWYTYSTLVDMTNYNNSNAWRATVYRHDGNTTDLCFCNSDWNPAAIASNTYGTQWFSDLVAADHGMYKPGSFSFLVDQAAGANSNYGSYDLIKNPSTNPVTRVTMSDIMNGKYLTNSTLTIEIVPKDVNVTIDDKTSQYGETFETMTATTDAGLSASDIGLTLVKDPGYNVGIYNIRPELDTTTNRFTNGNYNIASVTYGKYTITKREVTLILNDDWETYGNAHALNEYYNNTPAKDAEGNTIEDDNGDPVYKGGWRYDSGSKEFVTEDLTTVGTNKKGPLEFSSTVVFTDTEAAANPLVYRDVDSYDIEVVFTSYNLNNDVKFKTAAGDAILETGSDLKRAQF
ncbi:MAG: hypothetical protein K2J30_01450, partial [Clostridia bacterium]|nr:hypothetical protein [Clostridia bacterium]